MSNFPLFQMAEESIKLRFQEPFASDAINKKTTGIVPPGIFRGYIPNAQANFQLFINTDGASNDSVAVVETTTHYNLTVRTEQQLVLDFSGHATFPVFVVLRASYQMSPHPFSGSTDAKVVTTAALSPGDVVICSVTGIGGGNTPVVDNSARQDLIGPLLTQPDIAKFRPPFLDYEEDTTSGTVGPIAGGASVELTNPNLSFMLSVPGDVEIGCQFNYSDGGAGTGAIVAFQATVYDGAVPVAGPLWLVDDSGGVHAAQTSRSGRRRFAGLLAGITYTVKPTLFCQALTCEWYRTATRPMTMWARYISF